MKNRFKSLSFLLFAVMIFSGFSENDFYYHEKSESAQNCLYRLEWDIYNGIANGVGTWTLTVTNVYKSTSYVGLSHSFSCGTSQSCFSDRDYARVADKRRELIDMYEAKHEKSQGQKWDAELVNVRVKDYCK